MQLRNKWLAATVAGSIAMSYAITMLAPSAGAESEPLDGVYIRTIIADTGGGAGNTSLVTFTSCGPGCVHWNLEAGDGTGFNLYREGDKWMRYPSDKVITIIDAVTLQGSAASTSGLAWYMTFQLTKAG